MCRLYGLQATHPTHAACSLLDAQNALIQQSEEDARGLSNPHGWGMGQVAHGTTSCVRQVKPADESAEYRTKALKTKGTTLLAHVRRATVGDPEHVNTHPFRHGPALLIHNGHVPAFDDVRPRLLDRLDDRHRYSVQGSTDSEHLLALLTQLHDEHPDMPLHTVTRHAVRQVQDWVRAADATAEVETVTRDLSDAAHDELIDILGLNLLWTDGTALAGARLNRTLWAVERDHVHTCSVCGTKRADPADEDDYRATVLASERITDEDWTEVPNGSVFSVGPDARLHLESLDG